MNRNMITLDGVSIDEFKHPTRVQPRRLMSRKNKREKTFLELEHEADQIDKHRQNYKRASAKYATRLQWHSSDLLN